MNNNIGFKSKIEKICDCDLKLITVQNHENNQFNTQGKNVSIISTFRNKFGYPPPHKTRCFLAVSNNNEVPLFIVQKYSQPISNRPADEVEVYEIYTTVEIKESDIDTSFLKQLVSDLLFNTNSAASNSLKSVIKTWIYFINIAKYNKKLSLNEFIYKIGNKATDNVYEVVRDSLETVEQIVRSFYIMNFLKNTTNARIKSIEISCLNFDGNDNCTFLDSLDSSDILSALYNLPDDKFKGNVYMYLALKMNISNDVINDYIFNHPESQTIMFQKYIYSIRENNIETATRYRSYLNFYDPQNFLESTEEINDIIPDTLEISDMTPEILIVCLTFCKSNDRCNEFIDEFTKELKYNQKYRHDFMMQMYETEYDYDTFKIILYKEDMSSELGLIISKYNYKYIHDAFYLGFISYDQLNDKINDFDANCRSLVELALESYKSGDEYLKNFLKSKNTPEEIKKVVSEELKFNVIETINKKIRDCFIEIVKLYKEKIETIHKIRQLKK
jgi:hypothetical protein